MKILSEPLVKKINEMIEADKRSLTDLFQHIHQNPELSHQEEKTSRKVAEKLGALGFTVRTGIGKTGVVGTLENGEGPVVMYRADMDALPLQEETGLPYASRVNGVAHLCGHDAHVTWMLGMAKIMSKLKDQWTGTLVLVGQPAEETGKGARSMVEDGLYNISPKPNYFIAMHTTPIQTGKVMVKGGELMAGAEQLNATFHGKGSHGSSPQYSKDAVLMAAHAIIQYQSIISRVIDPRDTGVITVGEIKAGSGYNTIPDKAELKLNFRFFDNAVRDKLFEGVKSINNGIAKTYGMPNDKLPTIESISRVHPVFNTPSLTDSVKNALTLTGQVNTGQLKTGIKAVTGSEDALALIEEINDVEVAYIPVGTASPKACKQAEENGEDFPFVNHQPNFEVDLEAIPFGAKIAATVVLNILAKDEYLVEQEPITDMLSQRFKTSS